MARVWFGAGQGGSGQQGVDPRACCLVRCCCPLCWVLSVPLHPSCLPPTPELEAPPWPFLSLLNPWVTYLLRKSHSDLRPQTCPIRVLPRGTQLRALGAAGGLCWPGLCPWPFPPGCRPGLGVAAAAGQVQSQAPASAGGGAKWAQPMGTVATLGLGARPVEPLTLCSRPLCHWSLTAHLVLACWAAGRPCRKCRESIRGPGCPRSRSRGEGWPSQVSLPLTHGCGPCWGRPWLGSALPCPSLSSLGAGTSSVEYSQCVGTQGPRPPPHSCSWGPQGCPSPSVTC